MQKQASQKAIRSWMLYDWAQQPFHTLLVTFIFAPYFTSTVVGDDVLGQEMWGWMMAAVGLFLAFAAPTFGAIADSTGPRKPWMAFFCASAILGSFLLWYAVPNMSSPTLILFAFAIGLFGAELSQVFNNAMLADIVDRENLGVVSGKGWALGYAGGLIALVIMLLFFAEDDKGATMLGIQPLFGLDPDAREGTRFVGPFTGIWFAIFIIPLFLWVPDVVRKDRAVGAVKKGMAELWQTIKSLPQTPSLMAYLGSSMLYRDALNALYSFGGIYAGGVLGWPLMFIGLFGILASFTGALFTFLGGYLDQAIGPKKVIVLCVIVLTGVCVTVVGSSRDDFFGVPLAEGSSLPDILFFICGAIIGAAGGILQSASRTMVVDQADASRITEAFGLYALAGRATAFLAPFLIAVMTRLTGNQQIGFVPIILLFLLGLALLSWVQSNEKYR